MRADILRQGHLTDPDTVDESDESGEWVLQQDPNSGEIIRVWQANPSGPAPDPETPTLDSFRCLARGIVEGGIRVAGTTERFSNLYEAVDFVRIQFPAGVKVSRRDRITNIRDAKGNIIWREEERADSAPTIFNVLGVTPVPDPFGRHIENTALLERIEIQ